MKRTVRRNTFETNSSSMHSIVISDYNALEPSNLEVDSFSNKVSVHFGEFGWEWETYTAQYSRLQYLLTMVAETEGCSCESEEDFYNTDGFIAINDAISEYCNCDGIELEEGQIEVKDWGLSFEGYIDHQSSTDCYRSLSDFLSSSDCSCSIIDFIFGDGVEVRTGNDNG